MSLPTLHYPLLNSDGFIVRTKGDLRNLLIDAKNQSEPILSSNFSPPCPFEGLCLIAGPSLKCKTEWYIQGKFVGGVLEVLTEIPLQPGPQNFSDEELRESINLIHRQLSFSRLIKTPSEYNLRREELLKRQSELQAELDGLRCAHEQAEEVIFQSERRIKDCEDQLSQRAIAKKAGSAKKPKTAAPLGTSENPIEVDESLVLTLKASGLTLAEAFKGLSVRVKKASEALASVKNK